MTEPAAGFLDTYPVDLAEWEHDDRLEARGFTHPWRSQVAPGNGEAFFDALVHAHLRPESSVLDVGCGHGAYACRLAGRCRRVIGVDRDLDVLALAGELAAERGVSNVDFALLTAEPDAEIDLPDQSVDLFVCRRGPVLARWLAWAERLGRPGAVALGVHPTGPAGAIPPWNAELPEPLRLGRVFDYAEVRSWVTEALAGPDPRGRLDGCWWLDVPEYFDDPEQLYRRLADSRRAEIPYPAVKGELSALVERYGGRLELRHCRLVWKVTLDRAR